MTRDEALTLLEGRHAPPRARGIVMLQRDDLLRLAAFLRSLPPQQELRVSHPSSVPEEIAQLIDTYGRTMLYWWSVDASKAARAALDSAIQRLRGPTKSSEEVQRLRLALERIAYEPQGHAEASHAHVLTAVECIAKEALAIDYPGLRPQQEERT